MNYFRNRKTTWYNTQWRANGDEWDEILVGKTTTYYQCWDSTRSHHGLTRSNLDRFESTYDLKRYYTNFHILNDE